jgi:ParB family chromosome partitioning protein
MCYERDGRFPGSAYAPVLRKLDRFQDGPLPAALRRREDRAARLGEIEAEVGKRVAELRVRGFQSPYLRTLVVARINPVRFAKTRPGDATPPMEMHAALTRMLAAAKRFDARAVRPQDLALVAAVAPPVDDA